MKAIGLPNWAWSYEYPDLGVDPETKTALVSFPSNMLSDEDAAAAGKPRLLGVDNYLVVPVNTKVRVQVTAIGDKIHAGRCPPSA